MKNWKEQKKKEILTAKEELKVVQEKNKLAFLALPTNHSMYDYVDACGEYTRREKELKKIIETLEIEVLDVKYANHIAYSDINPFEVIDDSLSNLYVIREMKSVETKESVEKRKASFVPCGFIGRFDNRLQEWNITPDENGSIVVIRKHKDGRWYDTSNNVYAICERPIKFYDFNF